MESGMGQGNHYFQNFGVDFSSQETHLGGKAFPKGHFAVAVMNYGREVTTRLLYAGAVCYQAMASIQEDRFSVQQCAAVRSAIDEILHTLAGLEPFCYLDLPAEKRLLDNLFSQEVMELLEEYETSRAAYQRSGALELPEETQLRLRAAVVAQEQIQEVLRSYVYFCNDIANFATVILNLEAMKLRDLPRRNEASFAKACADFFTCQEMQDALCLLRPAQGVAGFSLTSQVRTEVILLPRDGELEFAKRYWFCRVMDFLVADFFEGLHVGHAPQQCRSCGRFFLMTSGRHQLYCDGPAPGDPKGRSCRTLGKRSPTLPREKAADDPARVLYRKRLNTINKHLERGKIDREFAAAAKAMAEKMLTRARGSIRYFQEQYPADISQAGLYAAVTAQLGRPPREDCHG